MSKRDRSIDFLRGSAIIFMTITHINAVYYTGFNPILDFLTTAGATICFSIFLFCSAYVTGISIQEGKVLNIEKTLIRSFKIYLTYILISFLIIISLNKALSVKNITGIILITNPPEFSEFLVSLALFSLLTILIYKPIQLLKGNLLPFVIFSIAIFITGILMYQVTTNIILVGWKQLLVENLFGYKDLHRFPIFFYFPIYTFGILLSYLKKENLLIYISLFFFILITVFNVFNLSSWHRWPPSILFLSYGFAYIPFILFMFKENILRINLLNRIGEVPLEQFILSTVLVFLPFIFIGQTESTSITVLINILALSILVLEPIVIHRNVV